MRVAIFSDVHGNLTALEAVLADIDEQDDIAAIIFAGDLCLLGPRPSECLALVRSLDIACLYGNTDEAVNGPPLLSDDVAEEQRERVRRISNLVEWTQAELAFDQRAWLRELPFHHRISPTVNPHDDLFIVHANPVDVEQPIWPPVDWQRKHYDEVRQTDDDLYPLLDGLATGVLAFGHVHVPFVRRWGDITLANISSVSLPGDDDGRAKYGLLEWSGDGWSIEHRYVDYDAEREAEAYRLKQPPGWQRAVERIEELGYLPQGS